MALTRDLNDIASYLENHVATKESVKELRQDVKELRQDVKDLDASFKRFTADTEQKLDQILVKLGG